MSTARNSEKKQEAHITCEAALLRHALLERCKEPVNCISIGRLGFDRMDRMASDARELGPSPNLIETMRNKAGVKSGQVNRS